MWFVDKLGPSPAQQRAQANGAAAPQKPVQAKQAPQAQRSAPQPQRAAPPPREPEPEKKKKKGWFG